MTRRNEWQDHWAAYSIDQDPDDVQQPVPDGTMVQRETIGGQILHRPIRAEHVNWRSTDRLSGVWKYKVVN